MSTSEQEPSTAPSDQPKRLERVDPGRLHGGVCAGLADYTGYDKMVAGIVSTTGPPFPLSNAPALSRLTSTAMMVTR